MSENNIERLTRIKKNLMHLKLKAILDTIDEELSQVVKESLSHTQLLDRLFAFEVQAFTQRRMERRIKESKLPELKLLSDFDFEFQPGIDKNRVMELATLSFVQRKESIIIAGNSGTGKSHIAKAILLLGCKELYRCRYVTASYMLKDLMSGLPDDTLEEKLKKYINPEMLLIDEIGFDRLEQESARNAALFFKVINGRYCKTSTIITTNIDFNALGDYLGDPVVTTAIVDRMVHHATIINIEGPSFRIHESEKINKRKKAKNKSNSKKKNDRKN
ncbi:MAG: ATP-binding protein [Desulfobacterales bacterium]|nr:ATP-binding protein [Desulfobacterales bacterium]